jgi:integrase
MPSLKRHETKYTGVYFVLGVSAKGKQERIFYIRYRKNGKEIEEKAGRQFRDDMTPARAANIRAKRIEGESSNKEIRELGRKEKESESNRWTFARLWEKYLEDKPELKGRKADESRFQKYLRPEFGNKEPRELLPLDIDRLRLRTLKGKSPQTVKLTLSLLRRLARFGTRKKLCQGLSFTIEMPKVDNVKTEDLSSEQLVRLLEAIGENNHPQAGSLMKLALFTGMRRGEMLRLRWEDVDFEKGFIRITNPKGGRTQRIPLNEGARDVLLMLREKNATQFVFQGKNGDHIKDLHKCTRKIADKAGLPKDFRPLHGLRHTYASMLASSGKVDMYTLQKLLTHKSPQMTQRYAHLRDETLRKAADLAGDLINKAAKSKKKSKDTERGMEVDNK